MQERMGAQQIEVARVQMTFGRHGRRRLERGPVQTQSGQVPLFDLGPESEPVNPVFEPVMIRRDDEKPDEKRRDRAVPSCVFAQPIEAHDDGEAGEEDEETPS